MPNIIEQQDLLKGLPDARLAMLLQSPTGDIPPFLVAAEAQRRQAIRQQFAGSENQESVVDSLTKQLVPQNIQAQPQATPPVPQTPQMQGVMALQQQQQMMQAAQAAQGQQMAGGGPVRRFAGTGYVRPTVSSLAGDYYQDPLAGSDPGSGASFPSLGDIFSPVTEYLSDVNKNLKVPLLPVWNDKNKRAEAAMLPKTESDSDIAAMKRRMNMDYSKKPADPGKDGTSPENQSKDDPQYEPMSADLKNRMMALYDNVEPGNWEKAQRWFDMAQQFTDPEKTTMQSVVGAGQAFAADSAQLEAMKRAAILERDKAALDWDINEEQNKRAFAQELAKMKAEGQQKILERTTVSANSGIDFYGRQIEVLMKKMQEVEDNLMLSPEQKEKAKALIQGQIDAYSGQASALMQGSGYGATVITEDQLRKALGQ